MSVTSPVAFECFDGGQGGEARPSVPCRKEMETEARAKRG